MTVRHRYANVSIAAVLGPGAEFDGAIGQVLIDGLRRGSTGKA